MAFMNWLRSLFGPSKSPSPPADPEEEARGRALLAESLRPMTFGDLSPATDATGPTSSWAGNFYAAPSEQIPVCAKTGAAMVPLVQIRVDELPEPVPELEGVALLNIWFDPDSGHLWEGENGNGFVVRTYDALNDLVPISTPSAQPKKAMPIHAIRWRDPVPSQPNWDDFGFDAAPRTDGTVEEWFFGNEIVELTDRLREECPVAVGGWPNWIQGSQWPEDSRFVLQVHSNHAARLNFGDGGSFYFFRKDGNWIIRADCC